MKNFNERELTLKRKGLKDIKRDIKQRKSPSFYKAEFGELKILRTAKEKEVRPLKESLHISQECIPLNKTRGV